MASRDLNWGVKPQWLAVLTINRGLPANASQRLRLSLERSFLRVTSRCSGQSAAAASKGTSSSGISRASLARVMGIPLVGMGATGKPGQQCLSLALPLDLSPPEKQVKSLTCRVFVEAKTAPKASAKTVGKHPIGLDGTHRPAPPTSNRS